MRGFIFLMARAIKSYSYLVQTISPYFITVQHRRVVLLTFRCNLTMIFISWMTGLLIPSLSFHRPFAYQYELDSPLCVITSKVFSIFFYPTIFIFLISLVIIICLYGFVLWHTTRFNRIHSQNISVIRTKRNIKVFQNILIILTVLIIRAAPYFISIIINIITEIPQIFHLISTLFISMTNTFESIAIFFTNGNVKTIFYIKIGWHHVEPSNNIPVCTRIEQSITIM
ncbi:unnamed protein product [Rotaria sp. Silwood1]|nr:unnamed protein product [Rotaria sp. Silwood1]CAF3335389.1 unnamed protein product [Rotaria sp. Silwood1]CAF3351776.1 unnamed protein product [Rotaria sp. Silwood1]CAF3356041.1 unnamed protein product [Rotaria sp. Silwood1]CAF3356599.1 unnamed protein product [Rotaria sp. Silwood1]